MVDFWAPTITPTSLMRHATSHKRFCAPYREIHILASLDLVSTLRSARCIATSVSSTQGSPPRTANAHHKASPPPRKPTYNGSLLHHVPSSAPHVLLTLPNPCAEHGYQSTKEISNPTTKLSSSHHTFRRKPRNVNCPTKVTVRAASLYDKTANYKKNTRVAPPMKWTLLEETRT